MPSSRGVDSEQGAGCTSTRWLSLPLISTRLGLEKARAPPTPGASSSRTRDPLRYAPLFRPGRGTRHVLPGARLGALAPHFFGSTQRTVVLDRLVPPPRSRLLLVGKGTDRSPEESPGQPPSLVLWWGPSLGTSPLLSLHPRAGNQQRKLYPGKKSLRTFPTGPVFQNLNSHPARPLPQVLPLGPATGDPTSRRWVTETILGVPSSPTPGRSAEAGASRGHGPGTSDRQGWKGRVDMSHLWKGVQRTS